MPRAAAALTLFAWLPLAGAANAVEVEKLSPGLARAFARSPSVPVEMIVLLDEGADLTAVEGIAEKRKRGKEVATRLAAVARESQAGLLAELERRGAPHRPYWIANFVWVVGDLELARSLAARPEVARIATNPRIRAVEPPAPSTGTAGTQQPEAAEAVEANVTQVRAPAVWAAGYAGAGAVVASADTGVRWDHLALKASYRGWNGSGVDHAYQWHDAIHSGGGSCGSNAAAPCDPNGHGTHTVGTMVGDDGGANRIGVAPRARWIACRNMDHEGVGSPVTYAECFQWFVAPTDLAGRNPRPDLAPDVINNSWGCTESEGCEDVDVLKTVVENTRTAGIVVVSSAGNSGSACSTVSTPPAIYEATFAVGAVDASNVPASFSSRGPVTADGSGRMKPDVAAPGENIRSAVPWLAGDTYMYNSGTSMAAPHVAGLVALLVSVDPALAGDPDALELAIRDAADHPATSTQTCGGVSATNFPNNTFGAGRVNALRAVQARLTGGLVFRDGFELRGASRWSVP